MPGNTEVRVTPHGIPYVVESRTKTTAVEVQYPPDDHYIQTAAIAPIPKSAAEELDFTRPVIRRDASFAAEARNSAHRHFKIFSDEFSASEETLVEFEASITLTPPVAVAPSEDGLSLRTGGLYITFPTPPTTSDVPSEALSSPSMGPGVEYVSQADLEKTRRLRLYRLSRAISKAVLAAWDGSATKAHEEGHQGLFKGTYSQVRSAFRAAGLVTTPCGEDGVPNATRLGALFIANPDGKGAVVFTKVVMWG
ncbi:hypothetical protein F5148DRAFT_1286282 [Russula earlei]|uniref:Uncharacterized protein n=1 Tax=Russula earlei TaxID=71964 RepID=A0ACC0U5C2_9AGAM|nr:hypothetical protein F5148DRAFT_1286282 [Russula earlei]